MRRYAEELGDGPFGYAGLCDRLLECAEDDVDADIALEAAGELGLVDDDGTYAKIAEPFDRAPHAVTERQIQVLGGVSLGPRERAVLISVQGQRLLLGVAPGRVQTLHVLGKEEQDDPAFAEQLEQLTREDKS